MIEALCVCLRAMQSIILYANETYDRGWLRLASPHLLPSFEPGPPPRATGRGPHKRDTALAFAPYLNHAENGRSASRTYSASRLALRPYLHYPCSTIR